MAQETATSSTTNSASEMRPAEGSNWWIRLLMWRERHLPDKTFVVLLALIVGTAAGLAAVLLKTLIGLIAGFLTSRFDTEGDNLLYLVFPAIGILLASLYVYYIAREPISHGVTRVLYALALKKSRLKIHNMYSSLIASSLTIGFGGSVGAEGPIVFTGAAIGSNLGPPSAATWDRPSGSGPRRWPCLWPVAPLQVSQASSRPPLRACCSPSRCSCST